MKTIPMVPACQNLEELQKLTTLVCECIHPEMVILFGHYAGMSFQEIRSGYEMLILVKEPSPISVRELTGFLKDRYAIEDRKEKNLSFHIFESEFAYHRSSLSYFFYIIRNEGILLYQNKTSKLTEKAHYKATRTHHLVAGFSEQCRALGKAFMQDAQRHADNGIPRLAAYNLYQAVVQFLRAANVAHYGFLPGEKEDLVSQYLRIRYCSKEIADLWKGEEKLSEWRMFGRIQSFSYKARFSYPYPLNSDLLLSCLSFAYKTEKAVEKFCQERVQFLESLI